MNTTSKSSTGIVISSTRRFVEVIDSSNRIYQGSLASRKLEAVPGDKVTFSLAQRSSEEFHAEIHTILERKNILKRSYERKTKLLVANLDILFVVTAPPPLFNPACIDRMLCAAKYQNIKTVLLANKSDLPESRGLEQILAYYKRNLHIPVIKTNALDGSGISEILDLISAPGNFVYAFSGVSGVGKSTILSRIFPDNVIRTSEVSEKTGQGRQTTSAAQGYPYKSNNSSITSNTDFPAIIVDLPGIQQFGLSHLDINDLQHAMTDIQDLGINCKFHNCMHFLEPSCAVQKGLDEGKLLSSRFHSYEEIYKEIKSNKSY